MRAMSNDAGGSAGGASGSRADNRAPNGGSGGDDDADAVRRTAGIVEPSPSPLIAACVAAAMCLEQLLDASTEKLEERAEPVRWAFDALHDLLDLTPRKDGFVPPRSSLPSPRQLARELAAWEWGTLRNFRCLESDECFAIYHAIVGNGGGFVVLTFGGLLLPPWLTDNETVLRRRTASQMNGEPVETHALTVSLSSPTLRQLAEWAPPVSAALATLPPVWPEERERRERPGPRLADGPLRMNVHRE
jgi:hypothetical protein